MYRIDATTRKGLKFRFRLRSDSVDEVRDLVDSLFNGQDMRLILIVAVA